MFADQYDVILDPGSCEKVFISATPESDGAENKYEQSKEDAKEDGKA